MMGTPVEDQRSDMEELVPLVYDELRRVAEQYFRKQPPGFTLRPTELVHEACLHLLRHSRVKWRDPEHFRAIATRKIWQVVVDHVRRRNAARRGGAGSRRPAVGAASAGAEATSDHGSHAAKLRKRPLDSVVVEWWDRDVALLDLADALEALGAESRRLHDVVTLHWFGGLTYAEVGNSLGISASTAEKDFRYAIAWLNRKLSGAARNVD
jgi:RNA polymerase sigma factor (sigma-70 family)